LFRADALQHFGRAGITLMYNRLISDWLSVSAGNNFMFTDGLFNPSVAVNFTTSSLQFYVAFENINAFYARSMQRMSLQFGFAIVLY